SSDESDDSDSDSSDGSGSYTDASDSESSSDSSSSTESPVRSQDTSFDSPVPKTERMQESLKDRLKFWESKSPQKSSPVRSPKEPHVIALLEALPKKISPPLSAKATFKPRVTKLAPPLVSEESSVKSSASLESAESFYNTPDGKRVTPISSRASTPVMGNSSFRSDDEDEKEDKIDPSLKLLAEFEESNIVAEPGGRGYQRYKTNSNFRNKGRPWRDDTDAATTFYYDRNEFMAALGDANVIQNVARRSNWDTDYPSEGKPLPFQQCDLNFVRDDENGITSMVIWNHNEPSLNEAWGGSDAYAFRVGDLSQEVGRVVETTDPFYAVGFDHISKGQGDGFAINIFNETFEYNSNQAHIGGKPKFYGWISDTDIASSFEIGSGPTTNTWDPNIINFMFTNIVYATTAESSVTSIGCYITNAAVRQCSANGFGDPHMVTFDGLKYDVHAKGEVTMVKSMNSTFEIQARLESAGDNLGAPAVTTGVVVNDQDKPRVQVSIASEPSPTTVDVNSCPVQLYVDGVPLSINDGTGTLDAKVRVVEDTVILEYYATNVRLDMRVQYFRRCLFSVTYLLADCKSPETLIGLLGSPNEKWSDDWMTTNGTVITIPEDHRELRFGPAYEYSTQNWCLATASESYFTYEPGKDFYDYALCGNAYDPTLEIMLNDAPAELTGLCGDDVGCLIDGMALGLDAATAYLEDPALDRTYAPTESPTQSPTGSDCPKSLPGKRRLDIEERWVISEDIGFNFESNDFDLKFEIGSAIADATQVETTLFQQDCITPYTGSGLSSSMGSLAAATVLDRKEIDIKATIDPAVISSDSSVYDETDDPENVRATVDFCMRFSLNTPTGAASMEVNYLEVVIGLFVDLTDGFEIQTMNVQPKPKCEVTAQEEFLVEGYFCEEGNEADDSYIPGILNQGSLVNICVRAQQRGRDLGVRMRRIASFTFTRDSFSQTAIVDGEAAPNGLTQLYCSEGYAICHFQSLLFASFFTSRGVVGGSGIADLQFGADFDSSETSVSPKVRRLKHRKLQDIAQFPSSAFDLDINVGESNYGFGDTSSSEKILAWSSAVVTVMAFAILQF
ncbi:MAG: hypothetical protein SGILL_004205, partial [Bacillariaceae sp.]